MENEDDLQKVSDLIAAALEIAYKDTGVNDYLVYRALGGDFILMKPGQTLVDAILGNKSYRLVEIDDERS